MSPQRATGRSVTLVEVAQRAGVSVGTASKAMNGRPDVGEATRARVMAVAKELAFAPNIVARSLLSGLTNSIGLITNDFEGRFVLPTMRGVEDALAERETVALMTNSGDQPALELRHLRALTQRRVDGLVMVGDKPEPRSPLAEAVGVPVAYAYAPSASENDVSVLPDHEGSGRLAVDHLLARGCQRISHIPGPLLPPANGHTAARLRADGCLAATSAVGLDLVGGLREDGDWTESWGWHEAGRLHDEEDFDALVCGNDQIARGAIDLLTSRGVRVPEDVAVVGFDNWDQIAAQARLPQTSIDMNLYEVGRLAARAVLQPGWLAPGRHRVKARLVERRSTATG